MTNEGSRKPGVFSLFSRIKTPKGEIRNNENCPNVTHGKNIWLEVMTYGLSAARSVRHDREPNIYPSSPTKVSQ